MGVVYRRDIGDISRISKIIFLSLLISLIVTIKWILKVNLDISRDFNWISGIKADICRFKRIKVDIADLQSPFLFLVCFCHASSSWSAYL